MAKVLTGIQIGLAGYLTEVGCEFAAVLLMITRLWDEEATIEMLEYCRKNPDASQAQLLETSLKISQKYEAETETH